MKPRNAKNFYLYVVTNNINGKKYVGITTSEISIRWRQHCQVSKKQKTLLQKAIAKHGCASFSIEHVASAFTWEALQELERSAIAQFNTFAAHGRGYNETLGGEGGDASSGRRRSDSHKAAISRAQKGKIISEETRRRQREAQKNRVLSPETMAKVLDALARGRKKPRANRGDTFKKVNAARKGTTYSDKWRKAISNGMRSSEASREHLAKLWEKRRANAAKAVTQ